MSISWMDQSITHYSLYAYAYAHAHFWEHHARARNTIQRTRLHTYASTHACVLPATSLAPSTRRSLCILGAGVCAATFACSTRAGCSFVQPPSGRPGRRVDASASASNAGRRCPAPKPPARAGAGERPAATNTAGDGLHAPACAEAARAARAAQAPTSASCAAAACGAVRRAPIVHAARLRCPARGRCARPWQARSRCPSGCGSRGRHRLPGVGRQRKEEFVAWGTPRTLGSACQFCKLKIAGGEWARAAARSGWWRNCCSRSSRVSIRGYECLGARAAARCV